MCIISSSVQFIKIISSVKYNIQKDVRLDAMYESGTKRDAIYGQAIVLSNDTGRKAFTGAFYVDVISFAN